MNNKEFLDLSDLTKNIRIGLRGILEECYASSKGFISCRISKTNFIRLESHPMVHHTTILLYDIPSKSFIFEGVTFKVENDSTSNMLTIYSDGVYLKSVYLGRLEGAILRGYYNE